MHIHIIGIGGTFMGSLAQLALALGHRVTGCDTALYPPMSDQLRAAGITPIEGFEADQLSVQPDLWVVGNVARRGLPIIEAILNQRLPMCSGPEWLKHHLLQDRPVLAVAGTHGKTTTSAWLAWILEDLGMNPGFLIGGVPQNFGVSARLGGPNAPFVIEADEYDTAFFDKRSKFLHYPAQVAVLNNLEFDHADIFPDLAAIETQFHHWIRTLPSQGSLVVNGREPALRRVLDRGSYGRLVWFNDGAGLDAQALPDDQLQLLTPTGPGPVIRSPMAGQHNQSNLLAAVSAAMALGQPLEAAAQAATRFQGVQRRLELKGVAAGVSVFDDFAHHPTAVALTLNGLRSRWPQGRILAVLEPRSNTMKMGVMRQRLADALASADLVFAYAGGLDWDLSGALAPLGDRLVCEQDFQALVAAIVRAARPGDAVLVMSNGGFGGIHGLLLERLSQTPEATARSQQAGH